MALTLQYKGFNYVDYYNGDYTANNSLPELAATGANSIALTPDFGIDVSNSTVVAGAGTTDASPTTLTTGDLGTVMSEAATAGVTTFLLRPLLDVLYPQASPHNPGNYYVPDDFGSTFDPDGTGATTIAYNPSGTTAADTMYNDDVPSGVTPATVPIGTSDNNLVSYRGEIEFTDESGGDLNAATFFGSPTTAGSYDYMIVNEAKAEAAALPAGTTGIFSVGTELDALATDQTAAVEQDWDNLIADVRAAAPNLKLTYSANWATAGDVTFWNKLDYVGLDGYVPLSNTVPNSANSNNPTLASLEAGWNQSSNVTIAYSGGVTVSQQLANEGLGGGNGSAIDAFDQLAQQSIDKQFIFTEIGYQNDTGAAADPTGGSFQGVADPSLQAELYQALFDAWGSAQQTAQGNGGDVDGIPFALAGAFIWTWNPDTNADNYDDWSPDGYPANTVITSNFTTTNPITIVGETNQASVAGFEGTPSPADGTAGTGGTGALAGDSDSNGATLSVSAVAGSAANIGNFVDTPYGEIELNADGSYRYFAENLPATPTGAPLVDVIDFTIEDTNGATNSGTLSITDYRNPTAVNESATVGAGQTIDETAGTNGTGALAGDSDPDGASLTVEEINLAALTPPTDGDVAGSYGTLDINADGSYSYTADSGAVLAAEFATNGGQALQDNFSLFVAGPLSTHAQPTTLTIDVTQPPSPPPPAAGAEVFWTDPATGDTGFWTFGSNGDVAGFNDLGAGSVTYSAVGVGDFDGSGDDEVLWENGTSGDTGFWTVGGGGNVTGFDDLGSADTAYSVAGVGDFDGSGHDEVLWEDTATGDTGYWTVNGSGQVAGFNDFGSADTTYSIVGVGDFDGAGHDEVLWEDKTTGDAGYWLTNASGAVTGFANLGSADTAYTIVGIGDFTGSGGDEVLWHDAASGDTGYWTTANGSVTGFHDFGFASTAYTVVGVGDYDGAGHDEVLWEDAATGDTGYWTTNASGQVTGFNDLAGASTAYHTVPLAPG